MAFEFDSHGFLTDRRSELEARIEEAYGSVLGSARVINQDCHELIFGLEVRSRDPQALFVATLFLRALEHYQATFLLIGTGLVASSKVTLRALIESVFWVRAATMDEQIRKRYVQTDLLYRKRRINRARNQHSPSLTELRESLTEDLVEDLDQKIKLTGGAPISVEELSQAADMHDWYVTSYAMLSVAVHSQASDVDAYFVLDMAEEIRELVYGPSMEDIPLLALTAADCILVAAFAVDQVFGTRFKSKLEEHRKAVRSAWEASENRAVRI